MWLLHECSKLMNSGQQVGPMDEDVLVQTLYESESKGISYRKALQNLHSVNNHPAHMWKDYYLEHRVRLDKLIEAERRSTKGNGKQIKRRSASPPLHPPSRDHREQKYSGPAPPKRTEQLSNGNFRFTSEDSKFMKDYIRYRCRENFSRNKSTLAEELSKYAPHHSKAAWRNFMGRNEAKIESILDAIQAEWRKSGDVCFGSDEDDGDNDESDEKSSSDESGYEDEPSEQESEASDEDEDVQNMSEAGGKLLDSDKRVMARFIASTEEWNGDIGTIKSRWEPFANMYTQRSVGAWVEAYRHHRDVVDAFVKKYRRRNEAPKRTRLLSSQTAIPSWSKKGKAAMKRKASGEDYKSHKRSR
ncbi:hypothetical protein EUX98_g176 [Antrodiella citrinella]|uniref:Uncharacterized protein n=1 Tax=Antrodiella citrinella TaxID=2447956 RepID=A0A4S4N860_9APHY|nr:hypothetical protein EUX98_g176 [Antrodiella citrinella]